jgi:hypothetical protein
MTPTLLKRHCHRDHTLGDLVQHAMEQLALSARAYDPIPESNLGSPELGHPLILKPFRPFATFARCWIQMRSRLNPRAKFPARVPSARGHHPAAPS